VYPFNPQPLAVVGGAVLAVLTFVAITAAGVALALAIAFGASRSWRHPHFSGEVGALGPGE
jgi:hypothetical protein